MMQNFKQKLYEYESTPPENIWDNIARELDNSEPGVIQIPAFRKRSKYIFYGLTAAASLLIIFISSLFFEKKNSVDDKQVASSHHKTLDSQANKSMNESLNNKTLKSIIESSKDKSSAGERDRRPQCPRNRGAGRRHRPTPGNRSGTCPAASAAPPRPARSPRRRW